MTVGACAVTTDGRIIEGANVENASYGLTLCAECSLVSDLIRQGGGRIAGVSIVAGDGEPIAPCGRCRQVLYEHGGNELQIDAGDGVAPTRLSALLPDAFGPEDLGPTEFAVSFFSAVDVITTKRDGGVLSDEAITWMLDAYVRGEVAEEQMSSLLMAIYFNGLSVDELNCWTDRMIESGERLDLSGLSRPTVDKHSTGGVGDKISLILAPLVASCGAAVPQLSGRGLGHTGGTLDKLESIPGLAGLSLERRGPSPTRHRSAR